jgi:hypothetical protein
MSTKVETVEQALTVLLQEGFLTGSRAFGTHSDKSDYDVAYSVSDSDKIKDWMTKHIIQSSEYFSGTKVQLMDGNEINLIPLHPHEFVPWIQATKAMKAIYKDYANFQGFGCGITKPQVHSIFLGMVCQWKAVMPMRSDVKSYNHFNREAKKELT